MAEPDLKKSEPKLADTLQKRVAEAVETKVVAKQYGIDIMGEGKKDEPKKDEGASLATTIVTEAMKERKEATQSFRDEVGDLRKLVVEKDKEGKENFLALITEKLGRVSEAQERAEAAAKGNKGEIAIWREINTEFQNIIASMPKAEEKHGVSDSVAIRLKEMELENTRVLYQMKEAADDRNKAFQIQLAQLSNDKEFKMLEYNDKKELRENALGKLTNIFSAGRKALIDAERLKETTGGAVGSNVDKQEQTEEAGAGTQEETVLQVTPVSFPCTQCGEKIEVPNVAGEQSLDCPGCHMEYKIKPKV